MPDLKYPAPLVWFGKFAPEGKACLAGHHVWDRSGRWVGVYKSGTRAKAEARTFR